jgi:hypothetical protein
MVNSSRSNAHCNGTASVSAVNLRLFVSLVSDCVMMGWHMNANWHLSPRVPYGMARMYSVLAEGVGAPADGFSDVAAAMRWLDDFDDSK